jgi:hypothetical protein
VKVGDLIKRSWYTAVPPPKQINFKFTEMEDCGIVVKVESDSDTIHAFFFKQSSLGPIPIRDGFYTIIGEE